MEELMMPRVCTGEQGLRTVAGLGGGAREAMAARRPARQGRRGRMVGRGEGAGWRAVRATAEEARAAA
jgi:hypothetical protein